MKPIENGLNIFEALQRLSDNNMLFASRNDCVTWTWKNEFIQLNDNGCIKRWMLIKKKTTLVQIELWLEYQDIRGTDWEIYEVEDEEIKECDIDDELGDYDGRGL